MSTMTAMYGSPAMNGKISQGVDLREQLRRSDDQIFHQRDNSAAASMVREFANIQVSE
jgi:hypothetical protein